MRRRKLLWHLFPSYLLITVLSVAAVSVYSYLALRSFYLGETRETLRTRAVLLEERVHPLIDAGDVDALDSLARKLGTSISTRITIVSTSGAVLADSDEDRTVMDNHSDRPEIAAALSGRSGSSRRYSYTLEQNMMYVAQPILSRGDIVGVVRTAVPLTAIEQQLTAVRGRILVASILLVVVGALVSFGVSERLARPLREMERGALRFARGEFAHSISVPRSLELAGLAESMNKMAGDLDARIRTVSRHKSEQEAIFAAMVEGIVAVDARERVITINRAAAEMFGSDTGPVRGRPIQELIRNVGFQEIISSVLRESRTVEGEVKVGGQPGRVLEATGAPMVGEGGEVVGAVVALNDVSRLRRLERVRRDFVANVSHELRTPVTSIKGFVETLSDEVASEDGNAARFLSIILKHADRLNAIIEDLLYLSRIEEDSDGTELALEPVPLRAVLSSAIDACRSLAEERNIAVGLSVEDGLEVRVNPQLFEHAVVNVLDNAIKYSQPGGDVEVEAIRDNGRTVVKVRDQGIGIAEEHQSRIFERFYQVDKSRSREVGGTGLGLSIAKHIAHAHGGSIAVVSSTGQGSTFSIIIPDSST